jgi:type I restriction enzyme R subunit
MGSNNALATHLLKEDRQGLGILTNLIYDLIKEGRDIDLGDLDGA